MGRGEWGGWAQGPLGAPQWDPWLGEREGGREGGKGGCGVGVGTQLWGDRVLVWGDGHPAVG